MAKFGVMISQNGLNYPLIEKITLESERLGFDSIWLHDHLFFNSQKSYPECLTLLSALSAKTTKIRLGTLLLNVSYRQPSLLAKMAATLDVISNGRLEFGIGAGWRKEEYIAYGFPFPSAAVRIQQLDEALSIIKKLWTEEKANFNGKYFSINNAICNPKPIQDPHPPIWVGGTGKLLLNIVAKHANGCNFRGPKLSPDEYNKKLNFLRRICANTGRNFDDMHKSFLTKVFAGENKKQVINQIKRQRPSIRDLMSSKTITQAIRQPKKAATFLTSRLHSTPQSIISGTPEECIEKIREYIDVGVNYFMLTFPYLENFKSLEVFAEKVLPEFKVT